MVRTLDQLAGRRLRRVNQPALSLENDLVVSGLPPS
jgi:hypothetical protein